MDNIGQLKWSVITEFMLIDISNMFMVFAQDDRLREAYFDPRALSWDEIAERVGVSSVDKFDCNDRWNALNVVHL